MKTEKDAHSTMEILLIRHGDPDYENDALTELGQKEAKLLADTLEDGAIDDIFVSPLGRAQETCGYTADRKGQSTATLDWLRERAIKRGDVYLWEAPGKMLLSDGDASRQDAGFDLSVRIPEGIEQFERVSAGFDALMATYGYLRDGELYRVENSTDKRIAIFCHKGVILTLLAKLLHWPLPMIFASLHIDPTGVTRLVLVEDDGLANFKTDTINDLSHLRSLVS
jgi:broad specificity phosphatase PhoE